MNQWTCMCLLVFKCDSVGLVKKTLICPQENIYQQQTGQQSTPHDARKLVCIHLNQLLTTAYYT